MNLEANIVMADLRAMNEMIKEAHNEWDLTERLRGLQDYLDDTIPYCTDCYIGYTCLDCAQSRDQEALMDMERDRRAGAAAERTAY